eukprot:GHVO01009410.1.p1 GENE.GHVO01009410.1~~GHVO01009410.1.p1  ORF type:complete len:373 (+),score=39.27 GHVO01009410.1:18-1136(+)
MQKVALITGITGQDGSYLADFLLDKGYIVHGIIRRSSSFNTMRIEHQFASLHLHYGDLIDATCLCSILVKVQPDEIYNLAAQSHVKVSFEIPEYTTEVDALGTLRLLEAIRSAGLEKKVRMYHASTSEMFGGVLHIPQSELTPFNPKSPYGCAKVFSDMIIKNYRESYGMYAVSGILFNHESPRRGRTFVTRKITTAVSQIMAGKQDFIELGNLGTSRDWGHAKDYVRAMWMMLQGTEPVDYVVSSQEQHTVRDFCELAFGFAGIHLKWRGKDTDEQGYDANNPTRVLVKVNSRYFRPAEVETLLGDSSKIRKELKWAPEYSFLDLVHDMLQSDFEECGLSLDPLDVCVKRYCDFIPNKAIVTVDSVKENVA